MVSKLSWSRFLIVIPLKNENEIMFYLTNAIEKRQSKRELQESIKSKEYYRLPKSTRNKLITNTKLE